MGGHRLHNWRKYSTIELRQGGKESYLLTSWGTLTSNLNSLRCRQPVFKVVDHNTAWVNRWEGGEEVRGIPYNKAALVYTTVTNPLIIISWKQRRIRPRDNGERNFWEEHEDKGKMNTHLIPDRNIKSHNFDRSGVYHISCGECEAVPTRDKFAQICT